MAAPAVTAPIAPPRSDKAALVIAMIAGAGLVVALAGRRGKQAV